MRFTLGALVAVIGSLVSLHYFQMTMTGAMAVLLLFIMGGKIAAG